MSTGKYWIYCGDQIINQINPMWPDFTFYIWLWHWCTFICRRRSVTALILFDKNGCLAYNPQKNLTDKANSHKHKFWDVSRRSCGLRGIPNADIIKGIHVASNVHTNMIHTKIRISYNSYLRIFRLSTRGINSRGC